MSIAARPADRGSGAKPFQQKAVDHLDGSALSHPWCPQPAVSLMERLTPPYILPSTPRSAAPMVWTPYSASVFASMIVRANSISSRSSGVNSSLGSSPEGRYTGRWGAAFGPSVRRAGNALKCREECVTPSLRALWSAWWGRTPKPEDLKHRLGARTQALKVDVPVARW
jgi:hypothetical protein